MQTSQKKNRRSVRLRNYDYRDAGAYFITICSYEKGQLFGDVLEGEMQLDELGSVVHEEWQRSGEIRKEMTMDAFVIMPNHIHGVVFIQPKRSATYSPNADDMTERSPTTSFTTNVGAHGRAPLHGNAANDSIHRKPKSLPSFVAGFKSICTKHINLLRNTPRQPVWQRNYYEHIIRNEADLARIRSYIETNPQRWTDDTTTPSP